MGYVIGVKAYRVKRTSFNERLNEVDYQIHETPLLIGLHEPSPQFVVRVSAAFYVPNGLRDLVLSLRVERPIEVLRCISCAVLPCERPVSRPHATTTVTLWRGGRGGMTNGEEGCR